MKTNMIPGTWKPAGGLVALVCVTGCVLDSLTVEAQQPRNIVPTSATEGYWAIVVGVETEKRQPAATYRTNDAELLAARLEGCGYQRQHILRMTQRAPAGYRPLRANLEAEMTRFLRRIGPEDRLLVYFGGCAYRDQAGQLYLAPADWDGADPAATGLSVTWLREQLKACPAEVKLSVLDISSEDSAAVEAPVSVSGQDVGSALEGVKDLTILTSCRADEKSLVWEPTGQSLFGFWFSQAVAGHADRDSNNLVSIVELYDYVFANVTKTARAVFEQQQSPDRLGDPRLEDTLIVSQVRAVSLRHALDEMAEQLAAMAVRERVSRMGVAEFRPLESDSQAVRLLGGGFGVLGRQCAVDMERRLVWQSELAGGPFELLPHEALHNTLTRGGFSPASFRTSATRGITVHGKEVETVVLGSFCARTGPVLTLRCDLRDTATQRLLGCTQATALLSDEELGMSGIVPLPVDPDESTPPTAPSPEHPVAPRERVGQTVSEPENGSDKLPFRVTIYVDDKPRESRLVERDEYVALARGEVYEIGVENRSDQPVYLRLLVDGLNTLPEPVRSAGDSAEQDQGPTVYRPAQRVHLDEASAWRLDSCPPEATAKRYTVQGFYRRFGDDKYEWETFKVVDARESLAYQQGYAEQTGLITAAFYEVLPMEKPLAESRSRGHGNVGTAGGKKERGELDEFEETPVGRLLHLVNIHYVEPELLDTISQQAGLPTP